MSESKQVVKIGLSKKGGDVEVVITKSDKGDGKVRLSLSGNVWLPSRRDIEAGGQIKNLLSYVDEFSMPREKVQRLSELWDRWHLNDMRPGCEHQRAAGWDKRAIDPSKPLDTYGKHFIGQRQPSWNMLAWVRPEEHPDGLLSKPCPVCGYKYGTAWLYEAVPADVLDELHSLVLPYLK